jgi:hypothetical protein
MPWKRAPNCATGPVCPFNISHCCAIEFDGRSRAAYNEMMPAGAAWRYPLLVCLSAPFSSCLARRADSPQRPTPPSPAVADLPDPARRYRSQYEAIRNFSATVDMVPALGSAEKNNITEYTRTSALTSASASRPISASSACIPWSAQGLRHGFRRRRFQAVHPVQGTASSWAATPSTSLAQQAGESPPAAFPGRPAGAPVDPKDQTR